jgi:hypothetical protein
MRDELQRDDTLTRSALRELKNDADWQNLVDEFTHVHTDFSNEEEVLNAVKVGDIYEGPNGEVRARNSGTVSVGRISRGLCDRLQKTYSGHPVNDAPVAITTDVVQERLEEQRKTISQPDPPRNEKFRRQSRAADTAKAANEAAEKAKEDK